MKSKFVVIVNINEKSEVVVELFHEEIGHGTISKENLSKLSNPVI